MKLAIINLSSGNLSGGYRKYLEELPQRLLDHNKINALRVYVPEGTNISSSIPLKHYLLKGFIQKGHHFIKEDLNSFEPDVIFIPTSRQFSYKKVPVVNMVRNMESLEVPFGMNPKLEMAKNFLRAWEAKKSTNNANRIIAVSNHVKRFLTDQWKMPSNKIGVVYHGIDAIELNNIDNSVPPSVVDIKEPFLFTAGSIRPARGLEDLIRAIPGIKKNYPDVYILIGGAVDPSMMPYFKHLKKLSERLAISDSLIWAGRLTREEMNWCYRNCKAFVMTSRAEACPNIVLEAMKFGAISVSTDKEPMPEFFQDHAIYYNGGDPSSLTHSILKMFELNSDQKKHLSESAKRRASEFTWEACAEKTVKEILLALNTNSQNNE